LTADLEFRCLPVAPGVPISPGVWETWADLLSQIAGSPQGMAVERILKIEMHAQHFPDARYGED
jgi:hypothetical protein